MHDMSVRTIDLHWLGNSHAIATYAIETSDGVLLVDPGPFVCHDALIEGLNEHGMTAADVQHVLITHIHLDHAGGAWWWAQHGGTAEKRPTIGVHSFGARHLINPSKLLASAQRIYADQMDALWGPLEPIDSQHVRPLDDGDTYSAGNCTLLVHETPGHARHHHAFELQHESVGRVCFCGDAAGMTVQHRPTYVSLPTPPPEFDLASWLKSLNLIHRHDYDALYPTHFGRLDRPAEHLPRVGVALRAHDRFIGDMVRAGLERDEIVQAYRQWLIDDATAHDLSERDIARHITSGTIVDMNVSGITRSWNKRLRQSPHTSNETVKDQVQ